MATLTKRVRFLEQENSARKRNEELTRIAIRSLASKEALEKLQETVEKSQERNDKLFDTLIAQNMVTNMRLVDLQGQLIRQDGKIVGLQTEMRQRLTEQDGKIVGLQTEMRLRFAEQDGKIAGLQTEMQQRFAEQDGKIAGLDNKVTELDSKVTGLQTTQIEQTALLQQILARLPE
jgi:GH35 family endo-1,4-beta-xylanase